MDPSWKNLSAKDCHELVKDAEDGGPFMAWGYRTSDHPDKNLRNTCFVYTRPFGKFKGNPNDKTVITGCPKPGMSLKDGCLSDLEKDYLERLARMPGKGVDMVKGQFKGIKIMEDPSWAGMSAADCMQLMAELPDEDSGYIGWGHRNSQFADPKKRDTCFMYELGDEWKPLVVDKADSTITSGCHRAGRLIKDGCLSKAELQRLMEANGDGDDAHQNMLKAIASIAKEKVKEAIRAVKKAALATAKAVAAKAKYVYTKTKEAAKAVAKAVAKAARAVAEKTKAAAKATAKALATAAKATAKAVTDAAKAVARKTLAAARVVAQRTYEAAKAVARAAKRAADAAVNAAKDAVNGAKRAAVVVGDAIKKQAVKRAREAAKAAVKAANEAKKFANDATREVKKAVTTAARKAAKETEKFAKKAAKETEKAAKEAVKALASVANTVGSGIVSAANTVAKAFKKF